MLSALSGASLTLTASGGPVSWSITESSGLIGKLSVAPASGRLLAGQSTTVSVNVSGGLLGLAGRAVPGTGGRGVRGLPAHRQPGRHRGLGRHRGRRHPEFAAAEHETAELGQPGIRRRPAGCRRPARELSRCA